jgi:hypothetical protein
MATATRILMVMSVMIVCVLSLWISLARAATRLTMSKPMCFVDVA